MKKIKILLILLIAISFLVPINKLQAASFSVSTSKKEVTVGDSFSVTINCSGLTGKFTISASSNIQITDKVWAEGSSVTVTATAKSAGSAKISVTSAAVTNSDYEDQPVQTVSTNITIKEKQVEVQTQTATPTVSASASQTQTTTSSNAQTTNSGSSTKKTTTKAATTQNKKTDTTKSKKETKKEEVILPENEEKAKAEFGITSLDVYGIKESGEEVKLELNPKFNINTYIYECKVESDIKYIKLLKEAYEYNDLVKEEGTDKVLEEGENVIKLSMQDESGELKEYVIKVYKEKTEKIEEPKEIQKIEFELSEFITIQSIIVVTTICLTILVEKTIWVLKNKKNNKNNI